MQNACFRQSALETPMFSSLLPSSLREGTYRKKFIENNSENLFMGSFENFAAAQAGVPSEKPVGYDNAEQAKGFYSHQIAPYDYPALFWIGRSLDEGLRSIFDLGGHV